MELIREGSSTLLEELALRYALEMIRQYHMRVDQIECDNKVVVESINGSITQTFIVILLCMISES